MVPYDSCPNAGVAKETGIRWGQRRAEVPIGQPLVGFGGICIYLRSGKNTRGRCTTRTLGDVSARRRVRRSAD